MLRPPLPCIQFGILNADSRFPPQPLTLAQVSGLRVPPLSLHIPLSLSSDLVVTFCWHIASSCQPGITPRKAALGLSYFISLPNWTLTLTDKDKREAKPQGITSIIQAQPNYSLGFRIMLAWNMTLYHLLWKWREAFGLTWRETICSTRQSQYLDLGLPSPVSGENRKTLKSGRTRKRERKCDSLQGKMSVFHSCAQAWPMGCVRSFLF